MKHLRIQDANSMAITDLANQGPLQETGHWGQSTLTKATAASTVIRTRDLVGVRVSILSATEPWQLIYVADTSVDTLDVVIVTRVKPISAHLSHSIVPSSRAIWRHSREEKDVRGQMGHILGLLSEGQELSSPSAMMKYALSNVVYTSPKGNWDRKANSREREQKLHYFRINKVWLDLDARHARECIAKSFDYHHIISCEITCGQGLSE